MKLSDSLEKKPSLKLDPFPQEDMGEKSVENQKKELDDLSSDISDIKSDIKKIQSDLDDFGLDLEDDMGRMTYVRQLTGEFLEYLLTLNNELTTQVDITNSEELMTKMLGRAQRKRYYMSKFRL